MENFPWWHLRYTIDHKEGLPLPIHPSPLWTSMSSLSHKCLELSQKLSKNDHKDPLAKGLNVESKNMELPIVQVKGNFSFASNHKFQ